LVFHAYINEMHGSRSKFPSKISRLYIYIYIYIYDVKFLALLGAPYIYKISVGDGLKKQNRCKKSSPYIHDVKFLALLGAPYIYDISRLRVN
jgi:hypothetical protein